jgi:Lrp/AsnC family transcriptional regulator
MNSPQIDESDRRILRALQRDSARSQRELADEVGMSQSACWRRLKALEESGLITGHTIRLDPQGVGLDLTIFMMVRTRQHSSKWLATFRKEVSAIPNVIDFFRIAGDYDYMLKVVAADMNDFDRVYQRIIAKVELESVTSYVTMEAILSGRDLPV